MKLSLLATAAAASLIAAPAQAATVIDLLPIGFGTFVGLFGNLDPATGQFTDEYEFTVADGSVTSTIGSAGVWFTGTALQFTSVTLNGTPFDVILDGAIDFRTLIDLPVTAGKQTLVVKGIAQSHASYGGKVIYTKGAGAAVPEPATWALLIAGFGLVGGALRSRRQVRVTYA